MSTSPEAPTAGRKPGRRGGRDLQGIFEMPYTPPTAEEQTAMLSVVLRHAKACGWNRERVMETIRAMRLDDLPFVARALARHDAASGAAEPTEAAAS